jgi:hypothetical protein
VKRICGEIKVSFCLLNLINILQKETKWLKKLKINKTNFKNYKNSIKKSKNYLTTGRQLKVIKSCEFFSLVI